MGEIIIERNITAKVEIKLICGECKKPLTDYEHYSMYGGKTINAFEIFPCECLIKNNTEKE